MPAFSSWFSFTPPILRHWGSPVPEQTPCPFLHWLVFLGPYNACCLLVVGWAGHDTGYRFEVDLSVCVYPVWGVPLASCVTIHSECPRVAPVSSPGLLLAVTPTLLASHTQPAFFADQTCPAFHLCSCVQWACGFRHCCVPKPVSQEQSPTRGTCPSTHGKPALRYLPPCLPSACRDFVCSSGPFHHFPRPKKSFILGTLKNG